MKFRKKNHLLYLTVVSIFLVWFIVAFLIYPNINIVYHTFFADGKFSIRAIENFYLRESGERTEEQFSAGLYHNDNIEYPWNICGACNGIF